MAAEQTSARRWWASVGVGAGLCVGCCLAPLLIAAGILGSGTLLVSLSWLEPLGVALLGLGTAGLLWSRWRARRHGCTGGETGSQSCADTGCGCASVPVGAPGSGI
ncbi:hypothetical protein LTV02_17910 [Nocardia yamanashiensis]|uniref:hypothetical protein n=1 Tax=Nocardia yamanashiensis TaxID=209247 RepID=UPI001E460557|nr:hypothetical protein [Nocardia yamanashiensis]UGT45147.1 hypothetical protein LTV02_17910 [Nocardia yamanashiensis]